MDNGDAPSALSGGPTWCRSISARESVKDFELATLNLLVGSFEDLRIGRPTDSHGRLRAVFAILLENAGNAAVLSQLFGSDDEEALRYRLDPVTVRLGRGDAGIALKSPADVHGSARRCRAR